MDISTRSIQQPKLDFLRVAVLFIDQAVRTMLEGRGIRSVAADGFKAPGVVVSYTTDPDIQNGSKFARLGLQAAAGVPLMCDEPDSYKSFRVGLFGLDKLHDVDGAVSRLAAVLDKLEG